MSRRSRIRKRERKKRQYAQRPKQVKPVAAITSTSGLIGELAQPLHTIAFREALESNKTT
jgi:NTP pyrophosphatase (non-canonical NTP hydrolase)